MQRSIVIIMLFITLVVKGQSFLIGHTEIVSDSINRAWYNFEIVDSIVYPDTYGFVVNPEIVPKNFISETEKKYLRYSKRNPYSKEFFGKYYPDSSYLEYMTEFKEKIDYYKIEASRVHDYNNSLDRLILFQNTSTDTIKFPTQDGSLIGLLESKENREQWKPIEYWWYSWCGNSFSWIDLLPSQTLKIGFNSRTGNNKVFLRYKIHGSDTIYLSPKFDGYISPTQSVFTKNLEQRMRRKNHGVSFLDTIRYGMCEENDIELNIIIEE
ncbi:hypothetical protein [Labilibacter marinus]|uniref:hypothetical protein n=1 Tax=Labilibacter marinus TaxID=1477105 RepID=UPI000833B9AD|nr:hypothetical protein [Labilibacter marinus]